MTVRMVLPPRLSRSAERLRVAAHVRGIETVQLPTFDVPAGLAADHLYAGPSFADVVAPTLGIALLEAPADWLARLPYELVRRPVDVMPIRDAWALRTPAFVRSPNDKSITAMVYRDGTRLPGADAVDPDTTVLVSGPVDVTVGYRLFVLDGRMHAGSQYGANGRLRLGPVPAEAVAFAADALAAVAEGLPSAVVVDIGRTPDGWAVIEANTAWASGCYSADARDALDVVLRAAGPATALRDHDRAFVRSGQHRPPVA